MLTRKNIIVDIGCLLLATLFFYAAISKLFAYSDFKLQLHRSPFITNFSQLLAWALPVTEIIIALSILSMPLRLYALHASLFLLSLFTCYLVGMLEFSYYVPCSCGGIISSLSWQQHIVFNLAFIIVNIITIRLIISSYANPSNKNI